MSQSANRLSRQLNLVTIVGDLGKVPRKPAIAAGEAQLTEKAALIKMLAVGAKHLLVKQLSV